MMKKYFLVFTILVTCLLLNAENRSPNWTFGMYSGLTWNSTRNMLATGLFNTANSTLENLPDFFETEMYAQSGCISLSTSKGELFLYSNGKDIYDKNGNIMPNGSNLLQNNKATQSVIIFPYPNNIGKYIVVTIGANGNKILNYSVVDMTLNNKLGDVIPSQKNISMGHFSGTISETVTSVLHQNGRDYWIVAPGRGSEVFLNAYLATPSGITTHPVVTKLLNYSLNYPTANGGYMKFTPDGKHFVWANYSESAVMYGDFDNSKGTFSNVRQFKLIPKELVDPLNNFSYGVEFSKSLKYLYVTGFTYLGVYDFQALLNTNNPSSIKPKFYNFGKDPANSTGPKANFVAAAVQLARDGRIYISARYRKFLYVIDNPEEYDNLRIYQLPDDFISAKNSTADGGLPSTSITWFTADLKGISLICAGRNSNYTVYIEDEGSIGIPTKLVWDFGDGSESEVQDVVKGKTSYVKNHLYEVGGKYNITVTPFSSTGEALSTLNLSVNVSECDIRSNKMIRTDLQNSITKELNR